MTHSELEVGKLMINLFNLGFKDYNHLSLALEVNFIKHDVEATRIKIEIPLRAFFMAL